MYPLLEQKTTREEFGGKINALIRLGELNINIPKGFIIDALEINQLLQDKIDIKALMTDYRQNDLNSESIQERIREAIDSILFPEGFIRRIYDFFQARQTYIVRSSGILEDGDSVSFAGQYDSILDNKTVDQVLVAIKKCMQSMFSKEVLSYWKENNLDFSRFGMAILIQEQIAADISGIAFSMNPSNGNEDELVLEYIEGLGDSMADGHKTPYTVIVNWQIPAEYQIYDGKIKISEIKQLKREIISIVELLGFPIDCEFCLVDSQLYILQVRPITAIPKYVDQGRWTTANFRDGGVASQDCPNLMWSLYQSSWQEALGSYLVENKFFKKEAVPSLSLIKYARPYWNVGIVKEAMEQLPVYQEREFDLELGLAPNYEGLGRIGRKSLGNYINVLPTVIANISSTRKRLKEAEQVRYDLLEEYTKLNSEIAEINSKTALKDIEALWLYIVKEAYIRSETVYFKQVFINTVQISLKKDRLLKYISDNQFLELLSNIGNVSHTRPYRQLKQIADWIRKDDRLMQEWTNLGIDDLAQSLKDDPFGQASQKIHAFQEAFGYHSSRELDLRVPSYSEDDRIILKLIQNILKEDNISDKIESSDKTLELIQSQHSSKNARIIDKDISFLRNLLWWREEFKDISTRYYHLIRQISLKLSERYEEEGVLKTKEDIFYLKHQKIEDYINGHIAKSELEFRSSYNKAYCSAYRNYKAPDDLWSLAMNANQQATRKREESLSGVGANNGIVTAKVRVLEDQADIWTIEAGEILVTRYTDTGWSPAFPKIAGLITETGGILSHAAVVAREYGIPTIVNSKQATHRLKTGMTIRLDGSKGLITIKDKEMELT